MYGLLYSDFGYMIDRFGAVLASAGILSGEIAARTRLQACNLFDSIQEALQILRNCPKAVPENGALLLVEMGLSAPNQPSIGKAIDLYMLVLIGGLEHTADEISRPPGSCRLLPLTALCPPVPIS